MIKCINKSIVFAIAFICEASFTCIITLHIKNKIHSRIYEEFEY